MIIKLQTVFNEPHRTESLLSRRSVLSEFSEISNSKLICFLARTIIDLNNFDIKFVKFLTQTTFKNEIFNNNSRYVLYLPTSIASRMEEYLHNFKCYNDPKER